MPSDEQFLPSSMLTPVSSPHATTEAVGASVDEIHQLAQTLSPDERLRLVARLWRRLPPEHRSALMSLHLGETHGDGDASLGPTSQRPDNELWEKIRGALFDPSTTSNLYSAPRRFDLATIFVVTAAFSLLLGGLSALGSPPLIMVLIGGMVATIAATQALFLKVANPRGVSILTGAIELPLFLIVAAVSDPRSFSHAPYFVLFLAGVIFGGIIGYLFGTVVGGVFLVADAVRGKFEGHSAGGANVDSADDDVSSASDVK